MCNRNTYFQAINRYFIVPEWKRQVLIEQTWFLSTVFLCSKFKLKNILLWSKIFGKNVCGNFYLREVIFEDGWKNRKKLQKLEPTKVSCHMVCKQKLFKQSELLIKALELNSSKSAIFFSQTYNFSLFLDKTTEAYFQHLFCLASIHRKRNFGGSSWWWSWWKSSWTFFKLCNYFNILSLL